MDRSYKPVIKGSIPFAAAILVMADYANWTVYATMPVWPNPETRRLPIAGESL
jgi:hypothetical protein